MVKTVMSAMVMALVAANDEAIQNPTVVTVVAYPGYAGLAKMHGTVNFYDYSNPDLGDNLMIYLGWNLLNVEDGCKPRLANHTGSSCTIAIHEGKTCSNASAIGGHLYDYPSSDDDPWGQGLQYDAAGYDAAGIRLAGSKNFDWHGVVVIKDHAGVRARCAVMPEKDALSASADDIVMPIGDMSPSKNIVELAESDPTLSTLVAAVVAGDLAETLSQPGPFTVFAPTNDAFNALPEGVLDSLMKPANKDLLSDILKFHVLPRQIFTDDLPSGDGQHKESGVYQTLCTHCADFVLAISYPDGVRVAPYGGGYTKVTAADNKASNGVVHIIDGVLLPLAGEYEQCGGKEFNAGLLKECPGRLKCVKQNDYYSQCLKPTPSSAVDIMV